MIDDEDYELSRRDAALERERGYLAGRDMAVERERGYRAGRRSGRVLRRDRAFDREEDDLDRAAFGGGVGGFGGVAGIGGGGATLVVLGIVLMAFAYFGFGLFGGDYGPAPLADYDTSGLSPAAGPYGGYGDVDLLSQRPMMFMGGGFLFLAGWILVVASRLRALITGDVY